MFFFCLGDDRCANTYNVILTERLRNTIWERWGWRQHICLHWWRFIDVRGCFFIYIYTNNCAEIMSLFNKQKRHHWRMNYKTKYDDIWSRLISICSKRRLLSGGSGGRRDSIGNSSLWIDNGNTGTTLM